jgi:Domain of unknown function (DUF4126)
VHLVFDIFQGLGIAAAVGIRPFLPALAVGALGAANVQIHFKHTDYSFLQSAPFLLAMVVCVIALALVQRRSRAQAPALAVALGVAGAVLGALLFAGSLARGHYAAWPGLIGGVLCAAVGVLATQPLVARVRGRLRDEASMLSLFVEAGALLLAVLSVLAPPIGLIGLAALVWLLVAGRAREGQKYAGLRVLR